MVNKAKTDYILRSLQINIKKTKKFWKVIKELIDGDECVDITSYFFKDPLTGSNIVKDETPDFLNHFFANIAERTRPRPNNHIERITDCYEDVHTEFNFVPPRVEDMYGYMMDIDINSSSCIQGMNSRLCKVMLDKIPDKFCYMFANSLYYSSFPSDWTKAMVTLIPKYGDKNDPGNWRPISQTVIFAKILEKIVHSQLLAYLQDNNILSKFQYGFLPGKSTQEAVFDIVRHVYSAINQNKILGMIFLDVAKAFNCIDHEILYKKFQQIGMCDRALNWFRSYLTRSQVIRYGNLISNKLELSAGIAQGTVLGPLIFIFYINDCIKSLTRCEISLYADDCVLYFTGNNWDTIHTVIQSDLTQFVRWATMNMLKLNIGKTQAMIFGTRNKLSKIKDPTPFLIENGEIKYVKKYNYLGIILDSEMTLAPLCKTIEKRVVDKIFMLRKLGRYLTYKAAIQIYKQVILPILDYAGFLLVACNKDKKGEFQVLQNDALRFCSNNRLNDRVSLDVLHNKANLVSLQLLSLMYKMSRRVENRVEGVRATRQHEQFVFRMDRKIGTKYATSPFYKGCKLWDKLSKEIQLSDSTPLFKTSISTLFKPFDRHYFI